MSLSDNNEPHLHRPLTEPELEGLLTEPEEVDIDEEKVTQDSNRDFVGASGSDELDGVVGKGRYKTWMVEEGKCSFSR